MNWNYGNAKPETVGKYFKIVDEWLTNGYDAVAAYQKYNPGCSARTASSNFYKIKKAPEIAAYIAEQRQRAYDLKCIDLTRVTEELAKMAFSEDVAPAAKVRALEVLRKALIEDEKALHTDDDSITIDLEEELDED